MARMSVPANPEKNDTTRRGKNPLPTILVWLAVLLLFGLYEWWRNRK